MSGYPKKPETVDATLRRVAEYPTVSPFSRAFYRFLHELIGVVGADGTRLGQAFHLFLRVECRRHESAGQMVKRGRTTSDDLLRAGRESHFLLDRLSQSLGRMEVADRGQMMARDLALAECYYHLGRTDEVVPLLQRAIRLGCRHPLVYFALGYNMYCLALQRYTEAGPNKGELIARDPRALDKALAEAIEAFEAGLGDEAFDPQIYWWIGLIQEITGQTQAACQSYEKALECDPDEFGERVTEKLRRLGAGPRRSPKELERLDKLGPITLKDIYAARFEMAQPEFFHPYFPDP